MEVETACPSCGEPISLEIDESGGLSQDYVEDCSVCCRPMRIRARVAGGRVRATTSRLDE